MERVTQRRAKARAEAPDIACILFGPRLEPVLKELSVELPPYDWAGDGFGAGGSDALREVGAENRIYGGRDCVAVDNMEGRIMAKDSYQKRLERHLVEYKQHRLGVRENGEFVHNGRSYSKAHILPRELQWLNIPEPFRREVREYVTEHRIKFYKYFHHLNSSQALALALFGPYVMRAPAVLARALERPRSCRRSSSEFRIVMKGPTWTCPGCREPWRSSAR